MIQLITREELFATKNILRSEITAIQKAFYDTDILAIYRENQDEATYHAQFDCDADTVCYTGNLMVLNPGIHHIESFPLTVALKLADLCTTINADTFILLTHLKLDLYAKNEMDHPALHKASQRLEQIVGHTTYHEGLTFNRDDLYPILDIIFWNLRYDANAPEYFLIFDHEERFYFYICRYGNVHLTEFNRKYFTRKLLKEKGWQLIEGTECDNFATNKEYS